MKLKILALLFLLMSFGTVCALFLIPILPSVAQYFGISSQHVKLMVSFSFMGFVFGHLIYGPLANAYGRKNALRVGLILQIMASFLAIFMGSIHSFSGLVVAKVLLALGATSGVKLSYTLIGDLHQNSNPARILGLSATSFAILPGLGIYLGTVVVAHFSWQANFLCLAFYGLAMLLLANFLPETYPKKLRTPISIKNIISMYHETFTNRNIVFLSVLLGLLNTISFTFPAFSIFIAFKVLNLSGPEFGLYSQIPVAGILLGNLAVALFSERMSNQFGIALGLALTLLSVFALNIALHNHISALMFFMPYAVMQFFMSFTFAHIPALLLRTEANKSATSASMNFLFMLVVWILVSVINYFLPDNPIHLAHVFLGLVVVSIVIYVTWFALRKKLDAHAQAQA